MAKKADFTGALGSELVKDIDEQQENGAIVEDKDPVFIVEPKTKKKNTRKTFPVYMEESKVNKIDRICNKTGFTRNELINKMVDFALDRYLD